MIDITLYVISVWQSTIMDFNLLKILLWISIVNKLCVLLVQTLYKTVVQKYFGKDFFSFFFYFSLPMGNHKEVKPIAPPPRFF